tara:strand:- start:8063 stop:8191 length:129 start_codon:yes stop_codon:yes gene_type:complete
MPDIIFTDIDGNEIRKDIYDINSAQDIKDNIEQLLKKRKDKK